MDDLSIITNSPAETEELGVRLGRLAWPGAVFWLVGKLGAGKTCLTRGIARGLGVDGPVLSPSFVLVRELPGRIPLYHADLYRLDSPAELADLGLEEYIYGKGLTVIEWADKGQGFLPAEHLRIEIEYGEGGIRRFRLMAHGPAYAVLLEKLG
jgi:tRNA threonylcarbamoyladenosine biosynthesis protein TsaE